jgi:uncharacterized damage-inducible protein DinB
MTMKQTILDFMNREVERSRPVLAEVPPGKYDWKPHDKSMIFGYLANMVATIPTWITAIVNQDSLDIAPKDGPTMKPKKLDSASDFVAALDEAAAGARKAIENSSDEYLRTRWQLKAAGNVVMEAPRDETILDTISHWSHHRGQMTVYLRLMGAKVPSVFGPSADDKTFR